MILRYSRIVYYYRLCDHHSEMVSESSAVAGTSDSMRGQNLRMRNVPSNEESQMPEPDARCQSGVLGRTGEGADKNEEDTDSEKPW